MASIQFHFCQFTPHLSFHTKLNIYLKLIQLYICTVHILQSYISDISFSCVTNMTCMIGPLRVQLALLPRGVLQISLSPSCELSLLMYGVERRRKTRDLTRTRFLKTCVEAVAWVYTVDTIVHKSPTRRPTISWLGKSCSRHFSSLSATHWIWGHFAASGGMKLMSVVKRGTYAICRPEIARHKYTFNDLHARVHLLQERQ
jgi:hypothetical protein